MATVATERQFQEYILVWETMPPAEYRTIHYRSSNFISLLNGNGEGDWYINLKLQAEDGSVFDKVNVEIFVLGGNVATVESIYFLNICNKDVLHVKQKENIKIRSKLLANGKFVVKLKMNCISSAVKPSIWLDSKTVVNQTSFKSIKSADLSKKLTVMMNNREYEFSTRKLPNSTLYIGMETIPRLWGIIAVTNILSIPIQTQIFHITKDGEHSYSTNTLLDAYTFNYTSFEEMDKASISKISKSINNDTKEEAIDHTELKEVQPLISEHLSAKDEVFYELYTNQKLCDVTVQSKDEKIRAHKVILASCSSVWRELFIGDETLDVVKITELGNISILMEYIYNGTVSQFTDAKLEQLLVVANKYGISGLKEHCSTLLAKDISMNNVLRLAALAHQNDASTLLNKVLAFIQNDFEEFKKLNELESFFIEYPELAFKIILL